MQESKVPKAKFSAGAVEVAIWENTGKEGTQYNTVSIEKHYKVGEEWKSAKSFKASELPKAILALQKAYEYLALRGREA